MSSIINASTSGVGGLVSTADNSGVLELQSGGQTKFTVSSEGAYGTLRYETVKNATGTAVDFTGIPSWVKRVTVLLNEVSTNGTTNVLVQVGTSSGVITTGYVSVSGRQTANTSYTTGDSTVGFHVQTAVATETKTVVMTLYSMGGNSIIGSWVGKRASNESIYGSGSISIGASPLDRIRITTANGTDTFDAGIINLLLEG